MVRSSSPDSVPPPSASIFLNNAWHLPRSHRTVLGQPGGQCRTLVQDLGAAGMYTGGALAQYTVYSIQYTVYSTQYTVVYCIQYTVYSMDAVWVWVWCAVCSVPFAVSSVQCAVCSVWCAVCSVVGQALACAGRQEAAPRGGQSSAQGESGRGARLGGYGQGWGAMGKVAKCTEAMAVECTWASTGPAIGHHMIGALGLR